MKIGKCRLCGKERELTKHHLIPKSIIKQINEKSDLIKLLIYLCEDCHKELHNSFITHIIQARKYDGYNKLDALNYLLIKDFLKSNHKEIYKEWHERLVEFLQHNLKNL